MAIPKPAHMLECNSVSGVVFHSTRSTSTVVVVAEVAFPVQLFFAGADFPCLEAAHILSTELAPVQELAWPSGLPDPNLQIKCLDNLLAQEINTASSASINL